MIQNVPKFGSNCVKTCVKIRVKILQVSNFFVITQIAAFQLMIRIPTTAHKRDQVLVVLIALESKRNHPKFNLSKLAFDSFLTKNLQPKFQIQILNFEVEKVETFLLFFRTSAAENSSSDFAFRTPNRFLCGDVRLENRSWAPIGLKASECSLRLDLELFSGDLSPSLSVANFTERFFKKTNDFSITISIN